MKQSIEINQTLQQKQVLSLFQIQTLQILGMGQEQLESTLEKEYLENPFWEKNDLQQGSAFSFSFDESSLRSANSFATQSNWLDEVKEQLYSPCFSNQQLNDLLAMASLLDDHGFLPFSDAELSQKFARSTHDIKALRKILKSLEPEGIGCQNIGDFFVFQLEQTGITLPDALKQLCLSQLFLTNRSYADIAQQIHAEFCDVKRWLTLLKQLELYPVQITDSHPLAYITPDIFIAKQEQSLQVTINDYYQQKYCISDFYKQQRSLPTDAETKEYYKKKLQQAKALYNALERRSKSVHQLGLFLAEHQKDFFLGGALQGLSYEQAAQELGLSRSTISRMVKQKYVWCEQGTFAAKHFFCKSVALQNSSKTIGKTSVQQEIARLVKSEDPWNPLSDEQLAAFLLKTHGILISRRTVSNYRKQIGIRGAYERKQCQQHIKR